MKRNINFANPFNGKKWLNLLESHDRYGIIFKKNLDIDEDNMGFSFRSNEFGLRGQGNIKSEMVILGTSYAMGLSVNNNENWYELNTVTKNAFNIGLPVGPANHICLLKDLYKGTYKELIHIYHPNIWTLAHRYHEIQKSKKNAFEEFNWSTDLKSIFRLYCNWKFNALKDYFLKREISFIHNQTKYNFTKDYAYYDFETNKDFIDKEINRLNELYNMFDKVTVIRVPIKEELVSSHIYSENIVKLESNYNKLWNYFAEHTLPSIEKIDISQYFDLNDYLPQDTHWSKDGNKKFIKILEKLHILS